MRALQGIGSAMLVPCSLALINHAYPEPARRAAAVSLWMGCGGVAMAAGPLIGGLLIHWLGWRSIFFVNVPIGLAGIGLTLSVERDAALMRRHFDWPGQAAAIAALGTLIAVLIEGAVLGWTSAVILAGIVVCVLAWTAFIVIEARGRNPMLPLHCFRSALFSGSTIVSMASAFVFYGMLFTFSLFFQQERGDSPLDARLAFLPMTIMVALGGLGSSRLVKGFGERGSMCAAFGLYAAAMLNSARQSGAALGVAIFGTFISSLHAFQTAMNVALGAVVAVSAVAAAVWWTTSRRHSTNDRGARAAVAPRECGASHE